MLVAWLACVVVLEIVGDRASAAREAEDFDYSQSDYFAEAQIRVHLCGQPH